MTSKSPQLHIFFLPHLSMGHMIPATDIATLFAKKGLKITLITTPKNAPFFTKIIDQDQNLGLDLHLLLIKFPSSESNLPEGVENNASLTSPDMVPKFYNALRLLQCPVEDLIAEFRPDCLVADTMFPWANHVADKFGIPRLVFHGTSYFAACVFLSLIEHKPHRKMESDNDMFLVPNFPHEIKLTQLQIPNFMRGDVKNFMTELVDQSREAEMRCFGVIMNSFYELESAYVERYSSVFERKAWHIGPVSLYNKERENLYLRGKQSSVDVVEWLDLKGLDSVMYVCFGSQSWWSVAQIHEIALGLEASRNDFILVLREDDEKVDEKKWLPEGFEERVKGRGLIIKGWAPQVLILEHEAVGGFLTHCGWNSILESIASGVPMVTWPLFAEQCFNEILVVDILQIGVKVGVKKWVARMEEREVILKEEVQKAVTRLTVGEEGREMRYRAKELKELARNAVNDGGSSHSALSALIEELTLYHKRDSPV